MGRSKSVAGAVKSRHKLNNVGAKQFLRSALECGYYVLDLETIGRNRKEALDPNSGRIQGFALKTKDCSAFLEVAPFGNYSLHKVCRKLGHLTKDPELTMIGHNLKFDIQWLIKLGMGVENKLFDTMVASWLLNENRIAMQVIKGEGASRYGLKKLVYEHFGHKMTAYSQQGSLFDLNLGEYALEDVNWTYRLWERYSEDLEDDDLLPVFHKIEMPLIYVLADMELTGVYIDPKRLRVTRDSLVKKRKKKQREIFKAVGHSFELSKDHQVAEVLYDEMGLPMDDEERPVPIGKMGVPSTKKDVLELFEADFPIARKILEWRHYSVLLRTFCHKLIKNAERSPDGRVHGKFNQTGTKIGRLSSSKPNLQNIPRPEGKGDAYHESIRGAFMAAPGSMFIGADLSQVELRLIAHLSGDPTLIEIYNSGGVCKRGTGGCGDYQDYKSGTRELKCRHVDVHTSTSETLSIPRSPTAKGINFGACYRIGARRLMSYAKIKTVEEARDTLDRWYQNYNGITDYHQEIERRLKQNGWTVETITGRKRRLLQESKINDFRAVTQGIQHTVSGSAQDLLKLSMVRLYGDIKERAKSDPLWHRAHFVLQVHDEIGCEAPKEIADELLKQMLYRMNTADSGHLRVELDSDGGTGKRWTDAH